MELHGHQFSALIARKEVRNHAKSVVFHGFDHRVRQCQGQGLHLLGMLQAHKLLLQIQLCHVA